MMAPRDQPSRHFCGLFVAGLAASIILNACSSNKSDWDCAYDTGMKAWQDPSQQMLLLNEAKRLADSSLDRDTRVKTNDGLAIACQRSGDYDTAIKVRNENVNLIGADSTRAADVAIEYAYLSQLYAAAKQPAKAKEAAEHAEHVSLSAKLSKEQKAEVLFGKGVGEASAGDSKGVADILAAIKIHRELWGKDDVRVLSDREALAEAYMRSNELDKAIDTERQVVADRDRLYLDWDPSVFKSLQLYLDFLELAGRNAEAQSVDSTLMARLSDLKDESPSGLKSGDDVNVHGNLPPLKPDLTAPRGHFVKS